MYQVSGKKQSKIEKKNVDTSSRENLSVSRLLRGFLYYIY